MTEVEEGLPPSQQEVLKSKFARIFMQICDAYHNPIRTKELVNYGLTLKIARQFRPVEGYYQWEREKIIELLQDIDFTQFFANTKNTNHPERRVFFMLKDPTLFLDSKLPNIVSFIRYSFRKYCYILSNERLKEIFYNQLSVQVTPVQYELRLAILDVVSLRTTFIKKISIILSNEEEKTELNIGESLKRVILGTNLSIKKTSASKTIKFPELRLIKSGAGEKT